MIRINAMKNEADFVRRQKIFKERDLFGRNNCDAIKLCNDLLVYERPKHFGRLMICCHEFGPKVFKVFE